MLMKRNMVTKNTGDQWPFGRPGNLTPGEDTPPLRLSVVPIEKMRQFAGLGNRNWLVANLKSADGSMSQ